MTVSVTPNPSDATVELDGETVKSKRVNAGATVSYEVSKEGYVTRSGEIKTSLSDAGGTVNKEITLSPATESVR